MIHVPADARKGYLRTCRLLVGVSIVATLSYVYWLLFLAVPDNLWVFGLLLLAELFNITQAAGFWYTIWVQRWDEPATPDFDLTRESVDVFITVCGEPEILVAATVAGAMRIRHPRLAVWVLDDGRSAEIERLTRRFGAGYLTRPEHRGAKAGNINDALACTAGDFVLVLDADHVPEPEIIERTLGAFADPRMAFAQTPQVYENRRTNRVAAGSHDQQALFYGPIMRGRTACDAVFSCGTNVVYRREALQAVGGFPEDSITEDLRLSLVLLKEGYKSTYVPVVLAKGLGPVTVPDYFNQQLRWARGGIEILLKRQPFFKGMPVAAVMQYGLGFQYWFTGLAYSIYLALPVAYLLFGARPFEVSIVHPAFFLPYIIATLLTLSYASNQRMSFRAIWFTLSSFAVHLLAITRTIGGGVATFVVTPKNARVSQLYVARVHVAMVSLLLFSCVFGIWVRGATPSVMNNVAFALGHLAILQGFIRYGLRPDLPPSGFLHVDSSVVPEGS